MRMLKDMLKDETLKRVPVFKGYKRFRDGRESTQDDVSRGRKATSCAL